MIKTKQIIGGNRAVIYVRVSTKEQVDEGNSLATQKKICQEYADKNKYEVIRVFEEQGESAKTSNRTELQKMLIYCAEKKNDISVLIIYKIDRLSRNTFDYGTLKHGLRKYGVELKSVSENLENSPTGYLMETMLSGFAQFDNDVRAERCSGGMLNAVRDGRYVWRAPIGYKNTKVASMATIAPSDMASLVRETYELIATGLYPVEDVWRMMTKKGLVKENGKPVGSSYFHEVIRNELYTGWIDKFGERHKGLFEPIVSEELFNQVQRILKNRGRKMLEYKRDNDDFPLRRFVMTPTLDEKLTGSWSAGRSGKKYAFYRLGMSKGKSYHRDDFQESFKTYMDSYAMPKEYVAKLKRYVSDEFGQATRNEKKEMEQSETRLKELEEKESQLIQKNLKGVLSDELLKKQLDLIENEKSDLKVGLSRSKENEIDVSEVIAFCEDYLMEPSKVWEEAGISSRLKLQWFQFPKGTTFDGEKFGTTEVSLVFKAKEAFRPLRSTTVDPTGFEPVTSSLQMRRSTN